ncbi:hypothetical protein HDU79_008315 [Rhizoclosmatium sp. JEL0117]|nr:hypothetical protein HDU79_008315 [Rhizoclosmatium sp. JEL0117]
MASKIEVCPTDRCNCHACSKSIGKGKYRWGYCEAGPKLGIFEYLCLSCVTSNHLANAAAQNGGSVDRTPGFAQVDQRTLKQLLKRADFDNSSTTATEKKPVQKKPKQRKKKTPYEKPVVEAVKKQARPAPKQRGEVAPVA